MGPYSQAVRTGPGDTIYCSCQGALDAKTGKLLHEGDIVGQTRVTLENLKAVLKEAGATLEDVVKVNIFLKDLSHFSQMNKVYEEYFSNYKPARTTVAAHDLLCGVLVDVDVIAVV